MSNLASLTVIESAAIGGFGDLADTTMNFLDSAVKAIRVESTLGPPIYIPQPFRKEAQDAAGGTMPTTIPGQGFDVARIFKPKITFEMRSGWGRNRSFAPYGNPGPSKWGFVVIGLIATLALAGYGGVELARR